MSARIHDTSQQSKLSDNYKFAMWRYVRQMASSSMCHNLAWRLMFATKGTPIATAIARSLNP